MLNAQKSSLKGRTCLPIIISKSCKSTLELGFMTTFDKPYQKDFIHQTNHPQSREIELSFLMMSGDYHI